MTTVSTLTESTPVEPVQDERPPRPEENPAILEAAEQLAASALLVAERFADLELLPGVRRRGEKLSRQLHAASRLLVRGSRLAEPGCLRRVAYLTRRAEAVSELYEVDACIRSAGDLLVQLHVWRGHTSCVPAAQRS